MHACPHLNRAYVENARQLTRRGDDMTAMGRHSQRCGRLTSSTGAACLAALLLFVIPHEVGLF